MAADVSVPETPAERLQRVDEMLTDVGAVVADALPYLQALTIIVPALVARLIEAGDAPAFVAEISEGCDENTVRAIGELLLCGQDAPH